MAKKPKIHLNSALQNRRETLAVHPLLKFGTPTQLAYQQIKLNPGITNHDLMFRMGPKYKKSYNTVREYVRKLKREGLVADNGNRVKVGGNRLMGLRAVTENESAFRRDQLEVEIVVSVNDYGEYSVVAKLKGQLPYATDPESCPQPFHVHKHKFTVPRIREPLRTRQIFHKEVLTITPETDDIPTKGTALVKR